MPPEFGRYLPGEKNCSLPLGEESTAIHILLLTYLEEDVNLELLLSRIPSFASLLS